jgi:hypothetical protein
MRPSAPSPTVVNLIALMDAASCFILSTTLIPVSASEPSKMDVRRLLRQGHAHKQQLPRTLFVPNIQPAKFLTAEAERQGITVIRVPEDQLLSFVGEARDCFKERFGSATQESGREFFAQGITGPVVMLNLLRFRATADYSATPHLAPASPITGEEAYHVYVEHTLPHLEKSGGNLLFFGRGGAFLIGPSNERWDAAMLVAQKKPSRICGVRVQSRVFGGDRPSLGSIGRLSLTAVG